MTIDLETKQNFENFYSSWTEESKKNWVNIHQSEKMLSSYRRIAAFQAVRSDLINLHYSNVSGSFFNEAHNDALVSHVSASVGAWRIALQSLRSFIENSLCAIYYHAHPIEFRNWERGKKKIGFTDLILYFETHPDLVDVPSGLNGLLYLKEEYKTLSLAVHASAKSFRMTDDVTKVLLWSTSKEKLNKWSDREHKCITGVILLLINLHPQELAGPKKMGIRSVLSYVFEELMRKKLKSSYGITITEN